MPDACSIKGCKRPGNYRGDGFVLCHEHTLDAIDSRCPVCGKSRMVADWWIKQPCRSCRKDREKMAANMPF